MYKRQVRLVLGEFVSGAGSSGSSIDDITYKPYLTGCITYAANSLNEGWRVLVAQGEGGGVYVKQGDTGYHVINRDSAGGTDHTGGSQPQDAVEMVSGADGQVIIIGLDQGTYWLIETKAPDGYRLLKDPIEIKIIPTYTDDRNNYIKGQGATAETLKELQACLLYTSDAADE